MPWEPVQLVQATVAVLPCRQTEEGPGHRAQHRARLRRHGQVKEVCANRVERLYDIVFIAVSPPRVATPTTTRTRRPTAMVSRGPRPTGRLP